MPQITVENVTGPVAHHGEGPVWSPTWGGLRWLDMLGGDLLTLRADDTVDRLHVGDHAAVVRPRTVGGFVVGLARGLAVADSDDSPVRPLPALFDDPTVRLNEGAAGPDGAFYAGGMADGARPGASALFRVEADGASRVVVEDVTCANGLAFSPDGTRAYWTDSLTHRVDVLDVVPAAEDPRGLVRRRPFVVVDPADGLPDGIAVDAEGGVWVALWGGSAVRRYSPDGTLDAVVPLPVSQVSACTFGGDGLDELYVTTSRQGFGTPDPDEAASGSLYVARPGVRGLPALPFAG
ncbi:SMP-30/gluconolactonase/LRE family protein [Cellulosimicrobium cellulans]|uniref:SMP-30/gluconolactonase/LRE family protein n=1 Tax=Cellulosimicrobium cellulans TaxID=1710 RepID=UPI002ED6D524